MAASSTDTLKDVVFERCRIRDLVIGSAGMVKNLVVSESVLKTINGNSNMKDCYISQNIFTAQLFSINNSTFSHNIFLYNEYDLLNTAESCLFIDNIICDDAITLIAHDVLNCMFVNNIFVGTINIPDGSNDGSDNIENQSLADIFVDVPDNFFDYSYDYNLVGTSPGNDAASDTTDIGIYGTSVPYKDGAVPFNPHIVSKNIDLKLNELNQLNIEIKVSAQDH